MANAEDWIVRLRPPAGHTLDDLVRVPLGLDILSREPDALVARASEKMLQELKRRRLADVERIGTTADYVQGKGKFRRPDS